MEVEEVRRAFSAQTMVGMRSDKVQVRRRMVLKGDGGNAEGSLAVQQGTLWRRLCALTCDLMSTTVMVVGGGGDDGNVDDLVVEVMVVVMGMTALGSLLWF